MTTANMRDRSAAQVVTIARFRKPANPRRCNIHRYHVWRWRGWPRAPAGLACQCGCLTATETYPPPVYYPDEQ